MTTRVAQEGLSAKLALALVIALYYLAVLSSHGVDLVGAIPALVGLLLPKGWLNCNVCRVLDSVAEKRKGSEFILEELEKMRVTGEADMQIISDDDVKILIEKCQELLPEPDPG